MTTRGNTPSGPFIEFPMSTPSQDESIRVTLVHRPAWIDKQTIRIQKRDANGHLFPGPEFPADEVLNLISALAQFTEPPI